MKQGLLFPERPLDSESVSNCDSQTKTSLLHHHYNSQSLHSLTKVIDNIKAQHSEKNLKKAFTKSTTKFMLLKHFPLASFEFPDTSLDFDEHLNYVPSSFSNFTTSTIVDLDTTSLNISQDSHPSVIPSINSVPCLFPKPSCHLP